MPSTQALPEYFADAIVICLELGGSIGHFSVKTNAY